MRFSEGIRKLARNTPGDRRRKTARLNAVEFEGCRIAIFRALRKENKVEVKQGKFTPSGESNFGPAGNMGEMKRSNSAEAFVPSVVSFAGLEGNNQKRHLWDWATASHNLNAAVPTTNHATIDLQSHPIFPPAPALDCPPLLFPMNHFPFCPPPSVPDFPVALIKTEDGIDSGGRIGLNLGQRTYFSSGDGHEMDHLFARSRGVYSLSHQPPRCQAEGCKVDLSGAKHYHRRHKVCEFHSKATVVIAHGLQQRFCQQCSRKRLADHNRRRRKPQLATAIAESSASVIPTANPNMEKTKQAQHISNDLKAEAFCSPEARSGVLRVIIENKAAAFAQGSRRSYSMNTNIRTYVRCMSSASSSPALISSST
ncbi:hypothetical protein B296_00037050 [Ensete ventricosum]|uniref:SBP-type domain-containing protein n=1 Tax=Ensete ventricosum TaxID=4639 RepID=A0A427A0J0_ENSVE|nr:hypothetical protein B296_00037050 [Ensete ventricosum]